MAKEQTMKEFELFVAEKGVSAEMVSQYLHQKRAEYADMRLTIEAMYEYAESTQDEDLVSEVVILETEFTDWCGGVMKKLSETTRKLYGDEVWEKVFSGVQMPQAGWTTEELAEFTYAIEQKYLSATTRENYECAHKKGGPFARAFEECDRKELTREDVDRAIDRINAGFMDLLREHHKSGKIFFNQKIDDAIIAEYESGKWNMRREGSKIIFMKIPFLMSRYLTETDRRMKRFYACHCPWARKSILTDQTVSSSFCYCSLGHDKYELESAFGRVLDGRVICSVLDGESLRCMFEVDIPADVLERNE